MKNLNLNLKIKTNTKQISQINFNSPLELILSGFKFSYLSPEKLEEKIFNICKKDKRFSVNSKNDCLEESLFNCSGNEINILDKNIELTINWDLDEDL